LYDNLWPGVEITGIKRVMANASARMAGMGGPGGALAELVRPYAEKIRQKQRRELTEAPRQRRTTAKDTHNRFSGTGKRSEVLFREAGGEARQNKYLPKSYINHGKLPNPIKDVPASIGGLSDFSAPSPSRSWLESLCCEPFTFLPFFL
jgi:hypothetical protein